MPEFIREERYLVFKITDLHELPDGMQDILGVIARDVRANRAARSKQDLQCVVVEHDWPEYEPVWKMIEKRVSECCGHGKGGIERCCERAGEYNSVGSDEPLTFICPQHCSCHD